MSLNVSVLLVYEAMGDFELIKGSVTLSRCYIILSVCLPSARDPSFTWEEPKFSSECYFLTLHCHHLSILPIIRRYSRRMRGIRELMRMCDEMERAEPQWRHVPGLQHRNSQLLKRWKSQVQVGTRFC